MVVASGCSDGGLGMPAGDVGAVDLVAADSAPRADQGAPTPDSGTPPPPDSGRPLPPDSAPLPPGGPKALPKAQKPCPQLAEGWVTILGVKVQLWLDPAQAKAKRGPLVVYWHGTGSSPLELALGLPPGEIAQIKAQGGIVAAPQGPTGLGGFDTGGIVWDSNDALLMDELVACAAQQLGIDPRRIHSMGMSAGGLHTAQLAYLRSGYLASVVSYSGGLIPILPPPPSQDGSNKLAAMVFHGGVNDGLIGFSFKDSSERFVADLRARGHFAFLCDHGGGHWLPPGGGAGAWRFFQDHPFGAKPSPYASGLPKTIPSYCSL